MNNLGLIHIERIRGDQAENLETAIAYFKQALEVRNRQSLPLEWASTISNMAVPSSPALPI